MSDQQTLTDDRKADFGAIYTAPDPRPYFRTLTPLGYQIPQLARPIVEAVLGAPREEPRHRAVLDVCCSYGINAATLATGDLCRVAARYTDPALDDLSSAELAATDARFYAQYADRARILGLDSSAPAVDYARAAGLLDDGWAEDLEHDEPSAALIEGIRDVGLVVCTGGVGYIGSRTFTRILQAVPDPSDLWLVICVLRVFDCADIVDLLARHGLVTERLATTLPQRRFADREEQAAAIHDVRRRGLDPTGLESEGWFHAECLVTRPAAEAAGVPLAELVPQVRDRSSSTAWNASP